MFDVDLKGGNVNHREQLFYKLVGHNSHHSKPPASLVTLHAYPEDDVSKEGLPGIDRAGLHGVLDDPGQSVARV